MCTGSSRLLGSTGGPIRFKVINALADMGCSFKVQVLCFQMDNPALRNRNGGEEIVARIPIYQRDSLREVDA